MKFKVKPNIRILLLSISGIIVSIFIIISALLAYIDPNQYKAKISQLVQQQTGGNLTIGAINWNFHPFLGITVHNLQFNGPTTLDATPLLTLDSANLAVAILPLLQGKLVIDQLKLNSPKLHLVTTNDRNNWQLTLAQSATTASSLDLALSQLNLVNLSLDYHDLATHTNIKLPSVSLKLKGQPAVEYHSSSQTLILPATIIELNDIVHATLSTQLVNHELSGSLVSQDFALPELITSLGLVAPGQLNQPLWHQVSLSFNFRKSLNLLQITAGKFTFGSSNLNFQLSINDLTNPVLDANLRLDKLQLADLIQLNGYQLALTNLTLQGSTKITSNGSALQSPQQLAVGNLTLAGFDLHNLSSQISHILSSPIKLIDLKHTLAQIQAQTNAFSLPGNKNLQLTSKLGTLSAQLAANEHTLQITKLALIGPDLRLTGAANFIPANHKVTGKFNLQFIADPTTLTGKVIYPITLTNNYFLIDWQSVNQQIAANLGASLTSSGKKIEKTTKSTVETIGRKLRSWF